MPHQTAELRRWIDACRSLAERSPHWEGPRSGASERGVERPFWLWRSGARGAPAHEGALDPDSRLWWLLVGAKAGAAETIDSATRERRATDAGSVFPQGLYRTIEVWTESELSSLHALWWLGRTGLEPSARERMLAAARWHLDNTQPDNATNRPWGVQVFLDLARADDDADARLYAETLLHNATAANGVPEPFSAAILLDCADALELMLEDRPGPGASA